MVPAKALLSHLYTSRGHTSHANQVGTLPSMHSLLRLTELERTRLSFGLTTPHTTLNLFGIVPNHLPLSLVNLQRPWKASGWLLSTLRNQR